MTEETKAEVIVHTHTHTHTHRTDCSSRTTKVVGNRITTLTVDGRPYLAGTRDGISSDPSLISLDGASGMTSRGTPAGSALRTPFNGSALFCNALTVPNRL